MYNIHTLHINTYIYIYISLSLYIYIYICIHILLCYTPARSGGLQGVRWPWSKPQGELMEPAAGIFLFFFFSYYHYYYYYYYYYLSLSLYIYIYIYIFIYVYIYIYVCMCIYIYIYTHTRNMHICIHNYIRTSIIDVYILRPYTVTLYHMLLCYIIVYYLHYIMLDVTQRP